MENIREWLTVPVNKGDGYGSGYEDGSGDGSSTLSGYGYGSGYGSGYADRSGSGDGSGSGAGSGYGYGYGSGYGYGDGYGSGDGYGDGSGSGYGYGSGDGYGDGSGDGYGYGYGYGISVLDGKEVHLVDDIQTIIVSIHMSLAKGFILNSDLTLTPCYVVKGNGLFAHGKTPQKAEQVLQKKLFENMDTDEAIERFCETFKAGERYSGHDFFEWHNYLTGSCEMGRKAFVRNHDIDLEKTYTVEEFIELTEKAYGGEVIQRLKEKFHK